MMSTNRAMATLVGMTVFWAAMLILATATAPVRYHHTVSAHACTCQRGMPCSQRAPKDIIE